MFVQAWLFKIGRNLVKFSYSKVEGVLQSLVQSYVDQLNTGFISVIEDNREQMLQSERASLDVLVDDTRDVI